ncbi:type 1 phosphatases regulator ypi1 [Aspergillus terreus]|uniref:Type 1 phosphatases regulator ypi1 n=1 Tax=Aspergillus terreus TaxID=33178 RepID=A0A5M3Z8R9_ASPTE|nr:hypothetical protein ATETN484_0012000800 [Aspergillus terreus]GFF19235.1 type 1 phosphatases regulator ypi1 [Aspergillus terreus]
MSQTRHQQTSGGTQSRVESLSPERAGISGILRLRAEDAPPTTNTRDDADTDAGPSRRIRWSEDVVDNEGMGKKSSKGELPLPELPQPVSRRKAKLADDVYPLAVTRLVRWESLAERYFRATCVSGALDVFTRSSQGTYETKKAES